MILCKICDEPLTKDEENGELWHGHKICLICKLYILMNGDKIQKALKKKTETMKSE